MIRRTHTRNEHGEPVLTITVVGWHDIFRVSWNDVHQQCEIADAASKTFQWMRRSVGAKRFDAVDQSLTGGKARRYSIRPRRREW